jgi:hypothetical protein
LHDALAAARSEINVALVTAGVLEHRAVVTGQPQDAEAYRVALEALDRAYAAVWRLELENAQKRILAADEGRARAGLIRRVP